MLKKIEKKEGKRLLNLLKKEYDIEQNIFKNYELYEKNNKIYLGPKNIIEKAISCGIPIYNLKSKKPSTTFFQSFGMFIKKNIIDLNKEQTIYYIDGKDILIVQNEKKYVLVKYKEFSIGCGLIKDNILKNQIPKNKQIKFKYI